MKRRVFLVSLVSGATAAARLLAASEDFPTRDARDAGIDGSGKPTDSINAGYIVRIDNTSST